MCLSQSQWPNNQWGSEVTATPDNKVVSLKIDHASNSVTMTIPLNDPLKVHEFLATFDAVIPLMLQVLARAPLCGDAAALNGVKQLLSFLATQLTS
jgi:hypothetical protein